MDELRKAIIEIADTDPPAAPQLFPAEFYQERDQLAAVLSNGEGSTPPAYLLERLILDVGGYVEERFEQRTEDPTGDREAAVGGDLDRPGIVLGHRGQPQKRRTAAEVQHHGLGLVGGGVTQGHEFRPVGPGLLGERRVAGLSSAGGQTGAGRQRQRGHRHGQVEALGEVHDQRGVLRGARPQAVVHVPDRQRQSVAGGQKVQQTQHGHRVGAAGAGHVHGAVPSPSGQPTAYLAQGRGDIGVTRWHGEPPYDSTSRLVASPSTDTPATFEPDDLTAIVDDPLMLDSRDDGHVLIPALPAPTFVRIARRLRDENRLEVLLPYATPYQLSSLLDLDGWVRDRVDIRRARLWLHAIAEHAPADKPRGALADLIYEMDPELWTVSLAAGTVVVAVPEDEDDARDRIASSLASLRTYETPDGFFMVGVPNDELGLRTLQTIHRIYDDDLAEGRKLCLAIEALLPAQAEEELLRFRNGRLADLGFVPWEEAAKLLRPLDHRVAAEHEAVDFGHLRDVEGLESQVRFGGPELLRRVMRRLSPPEHGLRSREFLLLVNEVTSAQRFDPGDDALSERSVDQTQSTLSLGLELLARQTPQGMEVEAFLAERVTSIGLRLLFRVGYGALAKVRAAAQLLHRGGQVSLTAPGSLLDRPWGPAIATLSGFYPELPRRSGKGTRPLRTLQDVAQATTWVAQAGALARLCFDDAGMGVDPTWLSRIDVPERLTLGDLVRTALIHAQKPGHHGTMAPLTAEDLHWAQEHLLTPDGLASSVGRMIAERCAGLGIGEHQNVLADNLLTRLQVELASLEYDDDGVVILSRVGGLVTVQHVSLWLSSRHGAPRN